jgi:hypothetical protein
MAFYAVLLPWHTVSQAITPLLVAAQAMEPPCPDHPAPGNGKQDPDKPRTNCPICKGLGTLHLAVGANVFAVAATVGASSPLPQAPDDDLVPGTKIAPQSRGPPVLST